MKPSRETRERLKQWKKELSSWVLRANKESSVWKIIFERAKSRAVAQWAEFRWGNQSYYLWKHAIPSLYILLKRLIVLVRESVETEWSIVGEGKAYLSFPRVSCFRVKNTNGEIISWKMYNLCEFGQFFRGEELKKLWELVLQI